MQKLPSSKAIFIALLLSVFVSTALADKKTVEVNKLFAQWDKPDTPGCALAIIKKGKIIYEHGYGLANLEYNIPISPRSAFYVGSISKQFVAMSIAMLAKEGKLSLDEDIRKYIPEVPDYGTPITVRNLIHHTSGLRDYLTLLEIAGKDFGTFHEEDVLELIARQKQLNFRPGEEYLYSNSGYFLLGIIVKRVSGKTLREFTDENIFRPLGMKNSHFNDDYTKLIKNRAWGYLPGGKGGYKNFISTFDCVGSGGLFTTVEDLFLWDQNFYHGKVGGKDLIDLIQTLGTLNNGNKLNYAFALAVGTYKGLRAVSHGGALGGYRSYMIRFPDQNFSVICLSNLSSCNPAKLSHQVADIYLADEFREEKPEKEKIQAEKNKFIKLSEEKLKEKIGAFLQPESGEMIRIAFSEKEQRLVAIISEQNFALAASSDSEFQVLEAPVKISMKFEKQVEGRPLLIHVQQEDEEPEIYESFKLWAPEPEQLKEYEGDYFSEELQVMFRLSLKEGKLYLVRKNARHALLQPTLKDNFSGLGLAVHFIRDEEKRISSFVLNAGRVRNLRFDKK